MDTTEGCEEGNKTKGEEELESPREGRRRHEGRKQRLWLSVARKEGILCSPHLQDEAWGCPGGEHRWGPDSGAWADSEGGAPAAGPSEAYGRRRGSR